MYKGVCVWYYVYIIYIYSLSDILLNPPLASCKLNKFVLGAFCWARAAAFGEPFPPYKVKLVGGLEIPESTGEPVNETEGDTALRFKPIEVG